MHSKPSSSVIDVDALVARFHASRQASTAMIRALTPEDCQAQSMDDASPMKWHLAHVTWFYEVMVLKQFEPSFKFWNPHFAILFNSYYNGVGDKHPRPKRGLLTRPSLSEVLEWRKNIDDRIAQLVLHRCSSEVAWMVELGINHEQQHQELMLTDVQHLFSNNSLYPVYDSTRISPPVSPTFAWIDGASGLQEVGYTGDDFHFDNESPRHQVFIGAYAMGNRLVTNGEWLAFIESGGYQQSQWWLDEAWAWVQREKITAPLYWLRQADQKTYHRFSLAGEHAIDCQQAVSNISYFEADAFARWAGVSLDHYQGARLPTEFEWEVFAHKQHPQIEGLFDTVWQWTSSAYLAYPGYRPWGGIAGEYNGKFMVNQMVLRGGSAYTSPGHSRHTYRNFFPTHARWQMTGLRLAKDQ